MFKTDKPIDSLAKLSRRLAVLLALAALAGAVIWFLTDLLERIPKYSAYTWNPAQSVLEIGLIVVVLKQVISDVIEYYNTTESTHS